MDSLLFYLRGETMPWSLDENREWIAGRMLPEDVVLDVGPGAGAYGLRLRDLVAKIDCIEIFEEYVNRFSLPNIYNEVFVGDFLTFPVTKNYYTTVVLGDVLEHFPPEKTQEVLDKARQIVGEEGYVFISCPLGEWPQGAEEGNEHEAHLATFEYEDMVAFPGFVDGKKGEHIGTVILEGKNPETVPVTFIIPTIAPRIHSGIVVRAVDSVNHQSLQPERIIVQADNEKLGAPGNRDRALKEVDTEWVATLDDDDYLYPQHLERMWDHAMKTGADVVYSWFDTNGTDPFPENFGKEWDPRNPVQTTVVILAKTDVVRNAGGWSTRFNLSEEESELFSQGNTVGEDARLMWQMNALGARISHLPEKTWFYNHHESNTSGMPTRW